MFLARRLRILAAIFLIALFPLGVAAKGAGRGSVYIPQDQTVEGNLYRAGETIQIDGIVNGDVIVAGGNITINGPVSGDVIAAGGHIAINGPVGGNVRLAGGDIFLSSVVAKNATIMGGTVRINKGATIGFEVLAMGGNVEIMGNVNRDLRVMAGSLALSGQVGRDVWAKIGRSFLLQPTAVVGGDVNYAAAQPAERLAGATIAGTMHYQLLPQHDWRERLSALSVLAVLGAGLVKTMGIFVLGMVLLWLAPKKVEKIKHHMIANSAADLGWGVLIAVVTPIACLVLALTVVGFPLAMALFASYLLSMLVGMAIGAFWLGELCLKRVLQRHLRAVDEKWSMLIGSFLLVIIGAVPILGWIAKALLVTTFFGALLMINKMELKKLR